MPETTVPAEPRWRLAEGVRRAGSSLFFGLTHLQLLQLPALVVAGLCFAWLRVATGRLGRASRSHMAFNASTVAFLYASNEGAR